MQLLCIARALVRRCVHGGRKVLVYEATGSVDRWCDETVQHVEELFPGVKDAGRRASGSIADAEKNVTMKNVEISSYCLTAFTYHAGDKKKAAHIISISKSKISKIRGIVIMRKIRTRKNK